MTKFKIRQLTTFGFADFIFMRSRYTGRVNHNTLNNSAAQLPLDPIAKLAASQAQT